MDSLPQEPPPGRPIPPVDKESCALLGPTGLLVQAIMAVIVVGSLVVKRSRENPRRPWPVWLADVGKQIIGQGFLHFTNVVFSTLFSHASRGDACTAYFLSIFVDCTLGVLIIYSTLRIFSYVLIQRMHLKGFRSGQYYEKRRNVLPSSGDALDNGIIYEPETAENRASIDSIEDGRKIPSTTSDTTAEAAKPPFQFSWWGKQLMVYLGSLVVMKLAILGFFWIPAVLAIGDWMLSWLGEDTKIVFVLMIFPLAMNAFQFLLIDTILKSKTPFSEGAGPIQEESTFSRRTSEDRDHHLRDEEDDRAFLLHDTTHDQIDTASKNDSTLPSYHAPTSQTDVWQAPPRQLDSASHSSPRSSLSDSKDVWASMADEDDEEDYSATPRPISRVSQNLPTKAASSGPQLSSKGAIPLRAVPSHKRRNSEQSRSSNRDGEVSRDGEGTGWDWLSDDGMGPQHAADDDQPDVPAQTPTPSYTPQGISTKNTKLA